MKGTYYTEDVIEYLRSLHPESEKEKDILEEGIFLLKSLETTYRNKKEQERFIMFTEAGGNEELKQEGKKTSFNLWSESFAIWMETMRIALNKLDFCRPFRVVLDYHPKQRRILLRHYEPTDVSQEHSMEGQEN